MINGMYLSTMGALAQTARHATISNNLANSNTHGFKPDWSQFRALPAENDWHPERRFLWDEVLMQTGGGVWNETTVTNLKPGPMQHTGNPFDIALHDEPGAGKTSFFMLRPGDAPAGEVRYSRSGHFIVNENGELRTPNGDYVLSPNGTPITIDVPQDSQVQVRDDGMILANIGEEPSVELGQIGVVRTADYKQMKKVGDSQFMSEGAQLEAYQNGVYGGYLEESAANPIEEMVNMVEASRIYEANMKFITIQDDSLGQTIRRIAAVA